MMGTIFTAERQPVPHVFVIITNPSTADEIAYTQADSAGHFTLETSESNVALAAATSYGWVYIPSVDTDNADLQVQLSQDCTAFRGQIELDDPPPLPRIELVRIGGFDADVSGLFGVKVAGDLSFEACLPMKEYYITLPPNFAERTILTTVPPEGALRVHAVTRKYSETPPSVPLDLSDESQAAMVANLKDSVRILGLGESNHGTADYTNERIDLAIALARQRQFSFIMIEAGYGETLLLDDYIKGADIEISDAIKGLGFWMWRTKSFLAALEKLRAYNLAAPAEAQITIIGIDVQTTKGAFRELTRSKGDVLSDSDLSRLSRIEDQSGKSWLGFSADDKAMTRHTLEQLAANRDTKGVGSRANRRALSARSILLCLDLLEKHGFWNESRARDKGMAQMAREAISLDWRLRGTLWAHVGHLSRELVVGATTMGEHLAASLGEGYQVWALLGFEGAARARSAKGNHDVIDHALPPPPEYSVETVLSRSTRAHGFPVSYWDFHRGSKSTDWLRGLRWLREFGATFLIHRPPFLLYDLAALDGVILFMHISPTVPLDTNP